jgi:CHAD domain-containing protein
MTLDRNRLFKPVRKLRKLIGKLDGDPTPKQVHSLRTNTRRFEAMFNALSLDAQGIGKSMLKDLGHIRRRAGKVRDMDVLTGFASTVHTHDEEECSVQLLEHLGARRNKLAGKLLAEAKHIGPSVLKDLKHTKCVLAEVLRNGTNRAVSADGVTAAAVKLASGLAKPQRLGRASLHPYRLKVKELSNVLKLAGQASGFINDLDKVKDAIGEWHDWEELISIAARVLTHGKRCGLLAELRRIAAQKYQRAIALSQKLRKTYLPIQEGGKSASAALAA